MHDKDPPRARTPRRRDPARIESGGTRNYSTANLHLAGRRRYSPRNGAHLDVGTGAHGGRGAGGPGLWPGRKSLVVVGERVMYASARLSLSLWARRLLSLLCGSIFFGLSGRVWNSSEAPLCAGERRREVSGIWWRAGIPHLGCGGGTRRLVGLCTYRTRKGWGPARSGRRRTQMLPLLPGRLDAFPRRAGPVAASENAYVRIVDYVQPATG
ncbi:hypothetical protein C8Q78DRAFT_816195 [Trametes maxima]|nr:hypothetical protein C8Q78DRAFT_816195 [Trametes maxima]